MRHAGTALVLGALLLGCAPSAPPSTAATAPVGEPVIAPDPVVQIDATFRAAERDEPAPLLDVTLTMDVGWIEPLPTGIALYFAPVELTGEGAVPASRFIEALGDGAQAPDGDPRALRWPVVDGRLVARYQVRLDHHLQAPLRGVDGVPHPTTGGWTVPGTAFVPTWLRLDDGRSLDLPGEIALELPAGWRHTLGVDVDDQERAASFTDLAWTAHLLGDYELAEIRHGEATVWLATSDGTDTLAAIGGLIERTLADAEQLLGPLPQQGRLFVVFDTLGQTHEGGLVGERTILLTGPDTGDGRATAMPGIVVVHELAHLWSRADEMWLNEGLTRLLEIALTVRLDDLDPDAASAALRSRLDRYRELAGDGRAVRGDDQGGWPYAAGAAALICLDAELHARGTRLLDVHRLAVEAHGLPLPVDAFLGALSEVDGELHDAFVAGLEATAAIPVERCLERLPGRNTGRLFEP